MRSMILSLVYIMASGLPSPIGAVEGVHFMQDHCSVVS